MPVRLRITFLFLVLVMIILGIVCSGIYYFSYNERINNIKTRLTNRAKTTAKLITQREIFDQRLVQRIDSLTTLTLKYKIVEAYDKQNHKIYNYSDFSGDTLNISEDLLEYTRLKGSKFFSYNDKEVISFYYNENNEGIVVISAARDIDGKNGLYTLFKILLVSFFIGNAIVLITGYFFSGRLLLPIKKIASDVEEISAQNLARRIKTSGTKDEWSQLTITLNSLLNRLQESFEFQRRFIANASHELSTPLTSISSQLEVSLQRERDAKEYRQVMESIYQDVRNMSKLTQTLLEFAKASGSNTGLEINLIRIDEIILRIPSEITRSNPKFSVSLEFEKLPEEEENLLVFGNEILLLMAIKNVAINACKYSDDQHATILLEIGEKEIKIIISDNGKGIPETELNNIFQPFYRVKENTESHGFGLGLSLALKIITIHKGSIKVTSVENKGTKFEISIPAAQALR